MTISDATPPLSADENRRQVLYWRLIARLFDPEEQASLESASLAVVEDIGLPTALLDPSVSVDNIVQRFPALAAEFDGLMVPSPDAVPASGAGPTGRAATAVTASAPPASADGDGTSGTDGPGAIVVALGEPGAEGNGAVGAGGGPGAEAGAVSESGGSGAVPVGTGANGDGATGTSGGRGAQAVANPDGEGAAGSGGAGAEAVAAGAAPAGDGRDRAAEVRRAALVGKVLLNVFNTGSGTVSAGQLSRWQSDAGWLERALGAQPGQLRGRGGMPSGAGSGAGSAGPDAGDNGGGDNGAGGADGGVPGPGGNGAGGGLGGGVPSPGRGSGGRFPNAGAGVGPVLGEIEADLVSRMKLREVLADPKLASQLTPSMSLVEQLLRDKSNLSGVALANAKSLIRRFVDEVAAVLRTQVERTAVGTIDRSVPPKRVFRNLDLDRAIWKNLTNWSPDDQRLYVDRLFYRHTASKTTPSRLIVVVDQSGSMVDSMVNCTILASIFAGLPKVDVHLIAYDTRAIDLTPWVHDPFEVLLRTNLGGGNDGPVAMAMARPKISEPRNTAMVWISDFYEFDRSQPLLDGIVAVHRSGVKFIPVGSVNSSGQQSVNPWFRQRFKDLGTPVISGHIRKLVFELKKFLA